MRFEHRVPSSEAAVSIRPTRHNSSHHTDLAAYGSPLIVDAPYAIVLREHGSRVVWFGADAPSILEGQQLSYSSQRKVHAP